MSRLCARAGMTRQNAYKQRKRRSRQEVDEELVLTLMRAQRRLHPRLGGRKLHLLLALPLQEAGVTIGRDRFFALLARRGLLVPPLPKGPRTTQSTHPHPVYPNRIRDFQATGPNQAWVVDITYVRTLEGFAYATLMTDAFSCKIVGGHLGRTLEAKESLVALRQALLQLPSGARVIHHSDQGCQFCCELYVAALRKRQVLVSMTETQHCAENAKAERVNGILKQEYGLGGTFATLIHARRAFDQAVGLYNHLRPHNTLNGRFPAAVHRQDAA